MWGWGALAREAGNLPLSESTSSEVSVCLSFLAGKNLFPLGHPNVKWMGDGKAPGALGKKDVVNVRSDGS